MTGPRAGRRLGVIGLLATLATLVACGVLGAPVAVGAPVAAARAVPTATSPVPPALTRSAPPFPPIIVADPTKPPAGDRLTAVEVLRIAERNPKVEAELRKHPQLVPYEYTRGTGMWQVSWFTPRPRQTETMQVYVSDPAGQVTQVWTGEQVAWTMARGYPGAFGRAINNRWIWIGLSVMFLAPFLPSRRRRPTLLLLDLVALLGLSVSLAFFNHADLGLSVPLVLPPLLYLLVRLLLLAFGIGRPRRELRTLCSPAVLAVGLVFLIGFRVGLDVVDSNVIDVGYAGVIGANKILYGQPLYGHFPADNPQGDTYGPITYDAYVPFNLVFGWSGVWDSLPAAHAAAIVFDLLTLLGLFLLGRQVRGPTTGTLLAYLWAAYPFTAFTLSSNSNDTLVACFLVWTLVVLRRPARRGVLAAWAGLTKFAPLALGPLLLRGVGEEPTRRQVLRYVACYALAVCAAMAYVVATGNLGPFWRDTIVYQTGRPAPFSIWGLWGGTLGRPSVNRLAVEQHVVQAATVGIAGLATFVPRGRRGLVEVAALGAAILICVELCLTYWFYLYIVWFFPLVIVALVLAHPNESGEPGDRSAASARPREIALSPVAV